MADSGYESLFKPGGLDFAIKAIKVSVPEEKQKELILKLCDIFLLVVEYAKQQNPPEIKKFDIYEIADNFIQLKEPVEENPPR